MMEINNIDIKQHTSLATKISTAQDFRPQAIDFMSS